MNTLAATLQRAVDKFFSNLKSANASVVELAKTARLHTPQGKKIIANAAEHGIALGYLSATDGVLDDLRTGYTIEEIQTALNRHIARLSERELLVLCQSRYNALHAAMMTIIDADGGADDTEQVKGINLARGVFISCAFLPLSN